MRAWLGALMLCCGVALAHAGEPPVDLGPLYAATLTDTGGKPVSLAALKGQPLVVNFWARWCGPCREEIPELAKRQARYEKKGVRLIGIALDDNVEAVRDFAVAYDMRYTVLLAGDQGIPLAQALGNPHAGMPFTLAIDRQGRVVFTRIGIVKPAEMNAVFDDVLKKP